MICNLYCERNGGLYRFCIYFFADVYSSYACDIICYDILMKFCTVSFIWKIYKYVYKFRHRINVTLPPWGGLLCIVQSFQLIDYTCNWYKTRFAVTSNCIDIETTPLMTVGNVLSATIHIKLTRRIGSLSSVNFASDVIYVCIVFAILLF